VQLVVDSRATIYVWLGTEPAKECEGEWTITLKRSERDDEKERYREWEWDKCIERECVVCVCRGARARKSEWRERARETELSYNNTYIGGEREAKRKPARKLPPPLPARVVRRDAGRGIDCGVGGGGDVTHGGLVPLACGTPHWLSAKHTAPSDRRRHRHRHRQTEQGAADCGRELTYIPSLNVPLPPRRWWRRRRTTRLRSAAAAFSSRPRRPVPSLRPISTHPPPRQHYSSVPTSTRRPYVYIL